MERNDKMIDSGYLLAIGIFALTVYLVCVYIEKSHTSRDKQEWKTMELAKTLAELCQSEVVFEPNMKAYIFLDRKNRTFRWSTNAFCMDHEAEICTIEAAGVMKLRRYMANTDILMTMASDILRAYFQRKGPEKIS